MKRCIHELREGTCVLCSKKKIRVPLTDPEDPAPRIQAQFEGACPRCGASYEVGDELVLSEGEWVCCAEEYLAGAEL
jgi:hypothetical protein